MSVGAIRGMRVQMGDVLTLHVMKENDTPDVNF